MLLYSTFIMNECIEYIFLFLFFIFFQVFFASDSHVAMIYARKYAEAFNRDVVTFDDEKEALHLDKKGTYLNQHNFSYHQHHRSYLVLTSR